jgi:ATP-dependent Lon protease
MARSQKQSSLAPTSVPQALPVLPLRNAVFFPHQVTPLSVGREGSVKVVEEAMNEESLLVIVAQTDAEVEKPTERDIHWVGTLAKVLKVFTMADGTRSVLMQGIRRVQLL